MRVLEQGRLMKTLKQCHSYPCCWFLLIGESSNHLKPYTTASNNPPPRHIHCSKRQILTHETPFTMPMITKIREDTEVWKCMRTYSDGTKCRGTEPAQMTCEKCGETRGVGAVANNEDGKKIGELKKVEATGIEHWEFNDN